MVMMCCCKTKVGVNMTNTRMLRQIVARLTTVLLSVVVFENTLSADGASIEAVKKGTKSFVREIRSIEFTSVNVGEDVNRESKEKLRRKETMRYFQSGNMFRSETSITLNGESLGDEISTYTGKRFQAFYKDKETMALKDSSIFTNPSRVMSPLVGIFSFFAKKGMVYTWSDFTSEKNIEDTFKQAKYIGNREYNGAECIVLEFPGVAPGFTNEVWFSQKNGYFPVKSVASANGLPLGTVDVKKLYEVTLDGDTRIFFPVEIVLAFNYPGSSVYSSSTSVVTVDTDTIKINHEIDDDFFTLPTTIAKQVNDIDQMVSDGTLLLEDYDIIEQQGTSSNFRILFVIVYIVIFSLIIYRLFLTKFR